MPLNMDITENNEKSVNENNQETGNVDGNIVQQSASQVSGTRVKEQRTVQVPLNILTSIKSVVEIITARGGFRAGELTAVGSLYESLEKLIKLE